MFPARKGETLMSHWKHLNFNQRKIIRSSISKGMKLCDVADLLDVDPTTISKEIKRNRIKRKDGSILNNNEPCKKLARYPYTCDNCKKRSSCPLTQYTYDAAKAQGQADFRLVSSRQGINMTEEEFKHLDTIIKDGVDDNQSIYHIIKDNTDLDISVPSVYRYINEGKLKTKRMDLPYAVKYKKRKVKKKYEYKENCAVDRANHTYLDFLSFQRANPSKHHIQMDFLGSIMSDKKSILVMTIPFLHYTMLFLIESPNSQKVINLFDQLEMFLSPEVFKDVFASILTDRDSVFIQFDAIEASAFRSEKRTNIFYCDALASTQKANVEQMNKQLRRFYPKGKSIDHITKEDLKDTEIRINATRVESLSGYTPDEAFKVVFGEEILNILKSIIV